MRKSPAKIRELGVRLSFVPEDRLGMGLVGSMDIIDNMMLRSYKRGKLLFVESKKDKRQRRMRKRRYQTHVEAEVQPSFRRIFP